MHAIKFRIIFTIIAIIIILISSLAIGLIPTPLILQSSCSMNEPVDNDRSLASVSFTDGIQHSIDLNEVKDYNLYPDFLPVINDPQFTYVQKVDYLSDSDQGIGIIVDGDARFYPLKILIWHGIVNDCVGGTPIVVSYCPLCQVGIAYNRQVGETVLDFSVSEDVWLENVMLYDKQTNSRWSTILGESVIGDYVGIKLKQVPSNVVTFKQWRELQPDSFALSQNTGYDRNYSSAIDLSPTVPENITIEEFKSFVLIVPQTNRLTMYPLLPENQQLIDDENHISITYTNNKPLVMQNDFEIDDFVVIPQYVWKSLYPDSSLFQLKETI